MPGKKTLKSKKKGGNKSAQDEHIRDIEFKQDMEEYGKVMRLLGDRKILIKLPDGSEILGVIPGKFRKKIWIAVDDVILISRREYQIDKVDVVHKYNDKEIRHLIQYQEIPSSFGKSSAMMEGTDTNNSTATDDGFTFQEEGEPEDDVVNFDDI